MLLSFCRCLYCTDLFVFMSSECKNDDDVCLFHFQFHDQKKKFIIEGHQDLPSGQNNNTTTTMKRDSSAHSRKMNSFSRRRNRTRRHLAKMMVIIVSHYIFYCWCLAVYLVLLMMEENRFNFLNSCFFFLNVSAYSSRLSLLSEKLVIT